MTFRRRARLLLLRGLSRFRLDVLRLLRPRFRLLFLFLSLFLFGLLPGFRAFASRALETLPECLRDGVEWVVMPGWFLIDGGGKLALVYPDGQQLLFLAEDPEGKADK